MKHICFITQSFNRQDSLIVQRQGRSLVKAGYKVSYVLCDGLVPEVKYGIQMQSINMKFDGACYKIACKNRLLRKIYRNKVVNRRLKSFLEQYDADIYQINDYELLPLGLHLKTKGKKVTYNLREYDPDYRARRFHIPTEILRKLYFHYSEKYLRRVAKKYDGLFSCMPEMDEYIRKVIPCRNFANVANFPVVNKKFTLSFEEYSKRANIISYFGTIYTISCQDEFLDAIQQLPQVRYLLAGRIPTIEMKERLIKHPAWKQVKFIDGFKREELPDIINSSIIGNVMKDFSLTETPEGSYSIIKIFETMEAAVPVILSKVPLYEKMVEKYHCGICVNPRNPQEIKEAIEYLLTHKREAYEMGQNGRRAVLEEFSWDSQWNNYIKVIEELTKE